MSLRQVRTVAAVLALLVAPACGALDTSGTASPTTTGPGAPPTTAPPLSSSAPEVTAVPDQEWAGTYEWTEPLGDGGAVVVRRLVLDEAADGLAGTYQEQRPDGSLEVAVVATTERDWLSVAVAEGVPPARYRENEILFTLTGGPEDPMTVLDAVQPAGAELPVSGRYLRPSSTATDDTAPVPEVETTEIGRGDRGELVTDWQRQLAAWAEAVGSEHAPLAVDGIFGPGTEAATTAFETSVGRPTDGVVDADDRREMVRALETLGVDPS